MSAGVIVDSAEGEDRRGPAYLQAVRQALCSVAGTFRESPASFLFEAGVQGLLYARLFDLLAREPVQWDLPGLGMPCFGNEGAVSLNPVQAEYPAGVRFDIALIGSGRNRALKAWSQPVRVGIELKLWQADGATGAHFREDREKLERYREQQSREGRRFTGLCVAFCHEREDARRAQRSSDADVVDDEDHLDLPLDGIRTVIVSASMRVPREKRRSA